MSHDASEFCLMNSFQNHCSKRWKQSIVVTIMGSTFNPGSANSSWFSFLICKKRSGCSNNKQLWDFFVRINQVFEHNEHSINVAYRHYFLLSYATQLDGTHSWHSHAIWMDGKDIEPERNYKALKLGYLGFQFLLKAVSWYRSWITPKSKTLREKLQIISVVLMLPSKF